MNEITLLHLLLLPCNSFFLFFLLGVKAKTPFISTFTVLTAFAIGVNFMEIFSDPVIAEKLTWLSVTEILNP